MKRAALGFRAHSGWAALVAVTLENDEPVVLRRERVQLVETLTRQFKQPYHVAAEMSLESGRKHIEQVRSEVQQLAHRAVRSARLELQKTGFRLDRCALLVSSGRPLPALEHILASHSLIHSAEGELFREVLAHGCERCGLPMCRWREKELLACAVQSLECSEAVVLKRATELGKPLGPPWSQDQKFAALAAWLALSPRSTGKLAPSKVESA